MADFDQAVLNLERFIGLLVNATSAVGQVEDHVQECSRQFAELEQDAGEEGGGLNDRLEELETTLESDEAEAVAALGELSHTGEEAQQDVAEVDTKVEQAATDLDQAADQVEAQLEQAATQLDHEGFDAFDQALETAQQELDSASQETQQALTELATATAGFETEAEAAWNEAEAEVESSTTALVAAETEIETAAQAGVTGFDGAADELEAACGALVKDVDQIYDALDSGVDAEGQAWEQAVDASAQDALSFVEEGRQQRLDAPASMVDDEALATLNQEYDALGTVLGAAEAPLNELEPLSAELVRAQQVVGQIDDLMSALA
jgi:DNA repair exonuclease SbcCD ATPase subunit